MPEDPKLYKRIAPLRTPIQLLDLLARHVVPLLTHREYN
jgi:hypothetical protein